MNQEDFEEIEPDDLQLAIQYLDDEYFEEHPNDDYYVRQAFPEELAMGGYSEYDGLILVYKIAEGARIRKPVMSIDEGVSLVVEYEKNRDV